MVHESAAADNSAHVLARYLGQPNDSTFRPASGKSRQHEPALRDEIRRSHEARHPARRHHPHVEPDTARWRSTVPTGAHEAHAHALQSRGENVPAERYR